MIALILSDLDAQRSGRAAAQPVAGACADALPPDAIPAFADEAPGRAAAGGAAGPGSKSTGGGGELGCADAGAPGGAAGEPAPMPQGGTLVVLPKTILAQWAQELQDRARAQAIACRPVPLTPCLLPAVQCPLPVARRLSRAQRARVEPWPHCLPLRARFCTRAAACDVAGLPRA